LPAILSLLLVPRVAPAQAAAPTAESLKAEYSTAFYAKDWARAQSLAQQMVDLAPTGEHLFLLGNAQIRTNANDDALATYERGLTVAETERPSPGQPDADWRESKGNLLVGKGNALLRLHRKDEARAAYLAGAELSPKPFVAYFNVCAMLVNDIDNKGAIDPCRKATSADPTKPNAWFLLATALLFTSPTDGKGIYLVNDETRQALNKYLELAPDGPHAEDVKEMRKMTR
jgi:tetratricopeptide (TPR) repeat protein